MAQDIVSVSLRTMTVSQEGHFCLRKVPPVQTGRSLLGFCQKAAPDDKGKKYLKITSRSLGQSGSHVGQTRVTFLLSPRVEQEREPIKPTKVNSLVPHSGVHGSLWGALDSALSTLKLDIYAMGVPPLPLEDCPTV